MERMNRTCVLTGSARPISAVYGSHATNRTTHRQMLKTKKTRTPPLH